jgi:hypothetical protein
MFLRSCSIAPRSLLWPRSRFHVGANAASQKGSRFLVPQRHRFSSFTGTARGEKSLGIHYPTREDTVKHRCPTYAIPPVSLTRRFRSDASTKPPTYDGGADARTEFSKPFFYKTKMHAANAEVLRKKFITEGSTVADVIGTALKSPGGLKSFEEDIAALSDHVVAYWEGGKMEERLHRQVVALNSGNEQTTFKDLYVPLRSMDVLLERETSPVYGKSPNRKQNICFVMGPSGSGKTFFALSGLLSRLGMEDVEARYVTIYLQPPPKTEVDLFAKSALEDLCGWIKEKLWSSAKASPAEVLPSRLKMHACVVIDEAAAADLGGFFESETNLSGIATDLKSVFDSVTLVLCGTGVTGRAFDSSNDSYKFRVQPWGQDEFRAILKSARMPHEITSNSDTIARAIFSVPVLNALTSNARSASFVVDGLAALAAGMPPPHSWSQRINDWTSALVDNAVQKYKSRSGIGKLKGNQPRAVAAWVFGALKEAVFAEKRLPQFHGLCKEERSIAMSLLYVNLEISREELTWVQQEEKFAISVPPAIAAVLFSMVGVNVSVFTNWKAQERISTLHLTRELIVEMYEAHIKGEIEPLLQRWSDQLNCSVDDLELKLAKPTAGKVDTFKRERDSFEKERDLLGFAFGTRLAKVQMLTLQTKIESLGTLQIPWINSASIFMNGDIASFADAVGPYIMVNGKNCTIKNHNTKKDVVTVYMYKELKKCGLMQPATTEQDLLLRGLFAIWDGLLDKIDPVAADERGTGTGDESNWKIEHTVYISPLQSMKAFPENFFDTLIADETGYLNIVKGQDDKWVIDVGEGIALPEFKDGVLPKTVTFCISTNARWIYMPKMGTISAKSLNEDGTLNLAKVKDKYTEAWQKFFSELRSGVVVKFLFTSPRLEDDANPPIEEDEMDDSE